MRNKHTQTIRQKVKEAYNSIVEEFNQTRKNQWLEFQYFIEYIENIVNKENNVKSMAKILDLGCGNGRLYDLLKDKNISYLGIDNSSGLIEKAKENYPEGRFEVGDMVSLDLPDSSFDVIFSIASFHHIPGQQLRRQAVDEMYRVLKKDGVLILTVWNLFQWKYIGCFIKAILSFILHLGLKYTWNDLWIKWGNHPLKRYYHAFLPSELARYFYKQQWQVEEFYFTRKGDRVKFGQSFNLCLIVRKKAI